MGFLSLLDTFARQVKVDVNRAGGSRLPLRTSVSMSDLDYKNNWTLIVSMNALLLILEMRGATDLKRTDGASRVLAAIRKGEFTP
jgi:hypothetical protein